MEIGQREVWGREMGQDLYFPSLLIDIMKINYINTGLKKQERTLLVGKPNKEIKHFLKEPSLNCGKFQNA